MTKRKLKVGLYGFNGHQIYKALYKHPDAQLTAICKADDYFVGEIRKNCANEVKVYETLEEMLQDETIELISLCSPSRKDQEADALKCLKAGKHVYAEKPATYTEEGLDLLLATAKENGVEFHEMAGSVCVEPYWTARKIVKSGKVGEVVQVYAQKSYPLNMAYRPQDEERDGGLVRQVGIHAMRFIEHITGLEVEEVQVRQTHLGNVDPEKGLYTASSWMMTLNNGGVASACINYLRPAGFPVYGNESVRIFGTEGMLEITDGGTKTHIYTNANGDEGVIDMTDSDCVDFFTLLAKHLFHGDAMPVSVEEELHPLRVVIRAFDNAKCTQVPRRS